MKNYILLIAFFWMASSSLSFGQDCVEFIQFKKTYEAGRLEEARTLIDKVQRCITANNLSKQDLGEFYKYLTLLYLDLRLAEEADTAIQSFMRIILRKNPDYDPRDNLPERKNKVFHKLYHDHRYWPTYYLGGKIGINSTFINVSNVYSVDQTNAGNEAKYSTSLSYRGALALELPILKRDKRFYFAPELAFSINQYKFSDKLLDFAALELTETQTWLQTPLLLKYYFQREDKRDKPLSSAEISANEFIKNIKNSFQPFVEAGISLGYLLSTKADAARTDLLPNGNSRKFESKSNNFGTQRKKLNYSLIVGGGFKLKNLFKTGWDFYLEGRYEYGLPNLVNKEKRGENENLLYNYGYIDSDFSVNSIVLSLGILIPHYTPKKLNLKTGYDFR
ncbi:MAG: porin family protein [Microscillaceae bacterium]|nr:porin family protein [Microscillaceae bacterium]